ncbi:hypothetical protein ABPG74_003151 [Tetrahymena malaccensis]
MNYKKTEDNARFEQTRHQQMIHNEIIMSENQQAKLKSEDEGQDGKDIQKQGVLLQNQQRNSYELKNVDSDIKIVNGQFNQIQNIEGLLKNQSEARERKNKQQCQKNSQILKKPSSTNLVQEQQYSKIQNPIVADIISDKYDAQTCLFQLIFILAFFIEQIATQEYDKMYEYLIIIVFILLSLTNFLLIKYQQFMYLHLVQIANSIMVTIIVGLWVYNNQYNQKYDVERYAESMISFQSPEQNSSNSDSNNNSINQIQKICQVNQSVKDDFYLLLLQTQSKFFFQGAILYRLQDCLNKHLIPKYRQLISIISSIAILILLYAQQIPLNHRLDFDLAIKCLFLILIIILYEKFQMRTLCSYLISFQALKKYFTLSLCNRSCHGQSNNIQIEINPKDLTSCKVIYGNQQLSQDLLSDSLQFFRDFELDLFSITNYNKIEQFDQGEEKALSQEADINNFDFGASTEKLKIKNSFNKIQQRAMQSKFNTASKQFIEQKILKFSSSELNKKRSSKHSNPTIVSLKRICQDDKNIVKEGDQPMTIAAMHTNINFNKTDNLIQTFRNTNNKNNIFQDYTEKQNNDGTANQNEKDQLNITPSLIKAQKTSLKSDEINTQSPAPKQSSEKTEKQAQISIDKKDTNNQDTFSLKTNEQSRVLPSSLANRYHNLEDIIKDPTLRSIQIQGKFKKSDGQKTQHLSISLIKYHNIFQNEIIIASITDMTSIQEINNLQKEVQFKEIMFANVTHDLRTPLYAIKYSIDKLKEIFQIHQCNTILEQKEQMKYKVKDLQESDVNDLHEQINISVANTHLMEAIIQDIIDNNRNRMGKLETDIRQFNLMELLQEMEKLMEIILWEKRKKIKLKFEICKQIKQNSLIYSDSQRLKQVLMNLISNSIKFTKKGGILIKVTKVYLKNSKNVDKYLNSPYKTNIKQKIAEIVEQNDPSQNCINTSLADKMKILNENQLYTCYQENVFSLGLIQFQIIDSGIGMNDKILKSLFTPYNTHNNENMNRHGIGLGLTICKTIVEKLGPFQLKVASKEKRGSKFTFYIYHDLHQSMIPSKLDQILPSEQKRFTENTTPNSNNNNNNINNNNNGWNYSHKPTNNPNEDEIHPMVSPHSFINLIPNSSEQNLKSEIYLDYESKDKASKQDSQSKRKEQDYYKSGNNQSILPESDKQSSTYQQDSRRKMNSFFQRGITNGSIFQSYQQNNQKVNTDKPKEIQEKDELKSMSQKELIDQSVGNNHENLEKEEKNKISQFDITYNNNINNFDSCQIMAKSPKFVSFNNSQSQHFNNISNYTNAIIQNKISDSINQIRDTEPNQKSNLLQKFSFGGNSSTVKKYQVQSLDDNTASKNNTSGIMQEKDPFDTNDKLQKAETDWKVNLAHSSEEIQEQKEKQVSQQNLKKEQNLFDNQNQNNNKQTQQLYNSSLNSTIASIVIGEKTANEKQENENMNNLKPRNTPFLNQNNEFTASRHVIHNNPIQKQVSFQQPILQKVQQPLQIQTEESSTQRTNSYINSPEKKIVQVSLKKQPQETKNKSLDIKQLRQQENIDQNQFFQKPTLFKNQDIQENGYGHDSSFFFNVIGGGFPSNIVQTFSRVTNQKSSKILKNHSYNTLDQFKCDQYVDEQQLDEDQLFNTSILQSLEDNQERVNLEESSSHALVKSNNQFQIMRNKKQTVQQQDTVSNINQKSVRESQVISIDKKGLYISKIDRYNHVTNHKMTESVQLNYIKKIKFGVAESDEQQEKQYLNILICDDSAFNIKILQRLLLNFKKYKMSIDTCLSGEEAIEKFLQKNKPNSQEPYNYIFLDWNMPIMDGYETSSKIKFYVKDEQFLDCPIIICTAYEDTTEINKCLRNGTDGILTKPISQDQINELLQDFQLSKETIQRNQSN